MSNRLVELMKTGQSIWFDNIKLSMLTSGELARFVAEDDLRGVTSNPSIFEKAINGSKDYDAQMRSLIEKGLDIKHIYESLVIDDRAVHSANDKLTPIKTTSAVVIRIFLNIFIYLSEFIRFTG